MQADGLHCFLCVIALKYSGNARVMELVDVGDSKSPGSDTVPVRVRPRAPMQNSKSRFVKRLFFYFTEFFVTLFDTTQLIFLFSMAFLRSSSVDLA